MPAPDTALAAPTGLRASTYSATSGEIFWRRPTTLGLRYEISRDGAVVRVIDGVSHYDSALAAGRNHRYDVVAIDRAGQRSPAASVTLQAKGGTPIATTPTRPPTAPTTPAPNGPQTITVANAEQVLGAVLEAYAGTSYSRAPLDLPFPQDRLDVSAYGAGYAPPRLETYAGRKSLVRDNGGTLAHEIRGSLPSRTDLAFSDCQLGTSVVDGTIVGFDEANRATLRDVELERFVVVELAGHGREDAVGEHDRQPRLQR